MLSQVINNPRHWLDRAAEMREMAGTMIDGSRKTAVPKLASDYERLGACDRAGEQRKPALTDQNQIPDYDFEWLARRLGQNDLNEWRLTPRDNDNEPATPAPRSDLFLSLALVAVIGATTLCILVFG